MEIGNHARIVGGLVLHHLLGVQIECFIIVYRTVQCIICHRAKKGSVSYFLDFVIRAQNRDGTVLYRLLGVQIECFIIVCRTIQGIICYRAKKGGVCYFLDFAIRG